MSRGMKGALLVLAALGVAQAGAQQPPTAYRCMSRGTVTYSQVPCPGGRPVGVAQHRETDKSKPPPQDRALAAKRGALTPEDRQECRRLDQRLREEERFLREKGEAATIQDEMPLVQAKKQFRELKC